MKLHVKNSEGFGLKLWLPTALLKSKFIIKSIKKHSEADIDELLNSLPLIYNALKEHIKKNGHFVLVDVESSDGDRVFIRL